MYFVDWFYNVTVLVGIYGSKLCFIINLYFYTTFVYNLYTILYE